MCVICCRHRQAAEIWKFPQVEVHVQDNCFVFLRGDTLVVLTNAGSSAGSDQRCEFRNPDAIPPLTKFTSVYPEQKVSADCCGLGRTRMYLVRVTENVYSVYQSLCIPKQCLMPV